MLSQLGVGRYLSYLLGIIASLAIFSVILLALGYKPIASMEGLLSGSFGTTFLTSETSALTAPLLLAALAFLVPFRARFYNIGAEGQLYMGALFGYLAASHLGGLPGAAAIPLMLLAAAVGGILWLALPLFMRIKFHVNEIFPTLVMNFIALDLVNWVTAGPLKNPLSGNLQTRPFPTSTWLPVFVKNTEFNIGIVVAGLAAIAVYFVMQRTVLGYEIRASGANPRGAQTGGISIAKSIIAVGLLSGALAGLAGIIPVAGVDHVLAQNFSPGYGYQGIAVAALGAFNPLGNVISAVLYSALSVGGESLQRSAAALPIQLIYALQAIIVLAVLIVQSWIGGRTSWRR
jgi:general nucleoside transport system permease protein